MGPGLKSLSCRTATGSGFGRRRAVLSKGTMMPLERRSEPQMLRQFQKITSSWWRLVPSTSGWRTGGCCKGETYADEIGRMTEAVRRS